MTTVYSKNGSEFDIDDIATDLNNKADKDLNNINPTQNTKNEIISWGMPDYSSAIVSSSLPFTAPCNGLFMWSSSTSSGYASIKINGIDVSGHGEIQVARGISSALQIATILISKNDVISLNAGSLSRIYFIPLKGAN